MLEASLRRELRISILLLSLSGYLSVVFGGFAQTRGFEGSFFCG